MIRKFLELLLSRSLDNGTPPPPWLKAIVRRNRRLGEFSDTTNKLDMVLRSSALETRQRLATDQLPAATLTVPPKRQQPFDIRQKSSRTWLTAAGVAAAVLLLLSTVVLRRPAPPVHAGEFSHQLTVVPGEVLRMINHAADTSKTQLPQLSPLAHLRMPSLPDWQAVTARVESPVQREIDAWQAGWQNLRSRFSNETREL